MNVETTNFRGWPQTLRVSNDFVELLVTTDVGPRIISYQADHRGNVMFVDDDECGGVDEGEFIARGGHRFWIAPEDWITSYHVDNREVTWRQSGPRGELVIESLQTDPILLRKTLTIALDKDGPGVTLEHTATNEGGSPLEVATWGVTMLRPGGLEIIPQPPMGSHPHDFQPNRGIVLWPYTDLGDPRLTFGSEFWLLSHDQELEKAMKIGLTHRLKWVGYITEDLFFIKSMKYDPSGTYPDGGCNLETFVNDKTLQLESLGHLKKLEPGESTAHTERWHLFPLDEPMTIDSEELLGRWLAPYLKSI